jgi:hypothetical protein
MKIINKKNGEKIKIIEYADLTDKQKEIVDACDGPSIPVPNWNTDEELLAWIRRDRK